MLKVVGASWYKTRVSTLILLGAMILAILALFIADMERPVFDGTYCATAFWSETTGFRIEYWGQRNDLDMVAKGVARICYKDTIFENGWSQIEIESQPEYPDKIQAFAAGILEGALTCSNIYSHWSNTIQSVCDENEDSQQFCTWLRDTISNNYRSIMAGADFKLNHDHYLHQIRLFYYQLEGMEFGFRKGVKRSRFKDWSITFEDFLLMNSAADIKDFRVYYDNFIMKNNNTKTEKSIMETEATPSMLFKVVQHKDSVQLLLGHSSAGSYSSMLRVLKRYRLHYHFTSDPKSHIISGVNMVFTGYPGILASMDDFYIISGEHTKLTVGGINIRNENLDLWSNVNLENTVLLSARLMSANRISHSGRSWARLMSRHPSTGSKQWIIIDNKRLHHLNLEPINSEDLIPPVLSLSSSSEELEHHDDVKKIKDNEVIHDDNPPQLKLNKGTIWIVDQLPGRLHGEDVSDRMAKVSYWNGNGIPYFSETFNLSKIINYNDTEKIAIKKLQENITDVDHISKLLKQRAFRGDLLGDSKPYGNIDVKLFSETNLGETSFEAIAGPLFHHELEKPLALSLVSDEDRNDDDNDTVRRNHFIRADIKFIATSKKSRPFRWSSSNLDADHSGHPDIWNFDKVAPTWAWPTSTTTPTEMAMTTT